MSGYSEISGEHRHRTFVDRWAPLEDGLVQQCPEEFRDQFRFTLAQGRERKDQLDRLSAAVKALRIVLGEVV